MSEKLTDQSLEIQPSKSHEYDHKVERTEQRISKADQEHGSTEHLEVHRENIDRLTSTQEQKLPTHQETSHHPVLINKQLKDAAFSRSMTRARKKLSAPSRVFSSVIHLPVIDRTSEYVGKTLARPSSMLGGATVALIGSSLLLWITRKYGYEYNYFAVILLFAFGFLAGLGIEAFIRLMRKKRL